MTLFYQYLKKYWKVCLGVFALATINQVFSLLDPLIFRHIIDSYATKFDKYTVSEFVRGVSFLLLLAMGTAFVSRVAKNFQDYFLNSVTQKFGRDIYTDGVKHSLSMSYEVFEDQRSGETLSVLQKVRGDTEKFIQSFINVFFISIISFLFVIVYASTIYWGVALMYFLTAPVIGFASYFLSNKIKNIQAVILKETNALSGGTTESLRNIELVKSLGLSEQEIKRLNSTTDKILNLELKKLKFIRSISFIQGTLINFIRTAILFFMLFLIFNKTITFGEFFSLWVYSFFVFNTLVDISTVLTNYRETDASLKNFQKILSSPKELVPESPKTLGDIEEINFKNISFKYSSAKENALSDITFKVNKGETVAFVGPSGSGKTSLLKILVGLYSPANGDVFYNDIGSKEVDKNSLRKQIGFVTQDTQLFAGTIRENLLFVSPDATDEQCLDALKRSSANSLLERAEKGLDTTIGEGGVKVSGGEKQRLSIARALLRKPNLLIFDEATSALDSLTEEEITNTVREISKTKNMITILIAHRLSTIMHSDRIYVLEKGKIIETGSHQKLLEEKGLYYAMWREQIGERK
jgi:ATP-binding cassette subfamily B protein